MEQLVVYLLKSVLCSVLFFGVYFFCLKNETFYRFNRYFLSAGLLCILILPLYTYTYEIVVPATTSFSEDESDVIMPDQSDRYWMYMAITAYIAGVVFLLLRQVVGVLKIRKVVEKFGYSEENGYKLVHADVFKSSFSFFQYVVLDGSAELNDTERKLILEHELAHVKQQHWADLLLAQIACAVYWFNPIIWWYLRAVRQNHEYLADEAVLKQGNSPAVYRAVLVNHCIGTPVFSVSSSFYRYPFDRISMLAKPSSGPFKKVLALMVLPALGIFIWAFAKPEIKIQAIAAKTVAVPVMKSIETPVKLPKNVRNAEFKPEEKTRLNAKKEYKNTTLVKAVTVKDTAIKVIVTESDHVVATKAKPLYLLDGVEIPPLIDEVDQDNIASIHVLKDEMAIAAYGERGRNGVILIYTKKPKSTID